MASSRIPPLNQAKASSESNRKDSNRWTTLKSSLVLGLTATQMALDGLPIPGAKGCVSLILHLVKTTDLTFGNAEALEALQSRLESLHEALSPVYANPDIEVPDDLGKGVRNLAVSLDKLAAKWKHRLEKKQRKRDFILRMLTAEDDRDSLTTFANSVEQAIQDFLVITITNGRIAAFREDIKNREARALHLLPRAPTASYDSARTGGANTCLKGTRISILKTIREWARNPNPNQPPMFWLNGLAGIGKTTIAHTMASELDAAGLLGASFVFLRADDQLKDACLVFPTLAFQLAQFDSRFRTALVEVLEHDPDCGSKRLDLQFASLFLRPFSAISLSAPMVIILDALDECEPEKLTSALLRILLKNIKKIPFLRIFITSRPEGYIRKALDLVDSSSPHQKLVLHENIHAKEVENDIRLFLRLRLQEIWDERTNRTSHRWPSEGNLEKLVRQSGRLFVYAATAVRFIGGNGALNLNRQLSTLLRVKIGHVPQSEPYQQLDGLYLQILDSVFPDSGDKYYIQRFRKVVGSIVLLERPLPLGSLANLLDCSIDDIKETLYHLHSIIIVPATNSEAPRTYHLSFPNFITNSDRCTNSKPYIDPSQQAEYLFGRCLAFLEKDFGPVLVNSLDADVTQDIHQLQSDTNTVKEITMTPLEEEPLTDSDDRSAQTHISLEDDIEDYHLAPEIRYSDNYWCRHLMNIPTGNQEAAHALERFVGRYLSKWLQRRKIRILANFGAPNVRLAGDTFDIIHDVHRWGSHSGCSNQFRMFLRQSAKDLYVQLFPDARVGYLFGKRLNPEDVAQSLPPPPSHRPPPSPSSGSPSSSSSSSLLSRRRYSRSSRRRHSHSSRRRHSRSSSRRRSRSSSRSRSHWPQQQPTVIIHQPSPQPRFPLPVDMTPIIIQQSRSSSSSSSRSRSPRQQHFPAPAAPIIIQQPRSSSSSRSRRHSFGRRFNAEGRPGTPPSVKSLDSVISLPFLNMVRNVPVANRVPLRVTNPDTSEPLEVSNHTKEATSSKEAGKSGGFGRGRDRRRR